MIMPAEAPFALQWPGCRNADKAFPTRHGGRVVPDARCILPADSIAGQSSGARQPCHSRVTWRSACRI